MGVLSGYRVIELAGMGPGPMAGMLLADTDQVLTAAGFSPEAIAELKAKTAVK